MHYAEEKIKKRELITIVTSSNDRAKRFKKRHRYAACLRSPNDDDDDDDDDVDDVSFTRTKT